MFFAELEASTSILICANDGQYTEDIAIAITQRRVELEEVHLNQEARL